MNITIIDNNAKAKYIFVNKRNISKYKKKTLLTILILTLTAIALFTYEIFNFNEISFQARSGHELKGYNLHLNFGISIALLFFSFMTLVRMIRTIDDLRHSELRTFLKFFPHSNSEHIIINNETILIERNSVKLLTKWIFYDSFNFDDKYIYIQQDSSKVPSVIIDKTLISEKELIEILDFLRQKFPESKTH